MADDKELTVGLRFPARRDYLRQAGAYASRLRSISSRRHRGTVRLKTAKVGTAGIISLVDFVPVSLEDSGSLALRWRDTTGSYSSLFISDAWRFFELDAVTFEDINSDGLGPGVVAIAQYTTGAGPTGGQPFPYPTVLLNDGSDNVYREPSIEELLSDSAATIGDVRAILGNSGSAQASPGSAGSVQYCFRNEYGTGSDKDVEELIVNVAGSQATGEYNWLPVFKDRRLGTFEGTFANDTIDARYTYQQEGMQNSAQISILIGDNQAVVTGDEPALGLSAALAQAGCPE